MLAHLRLSQHWVHWHAPLEGGGGREHAMTNAIPLLLEDTKAVNNSGKDSSEMISYQVPVNNRH